MSPAPRYPAATIRFDRQGPSGNAFMVVARASRALKAAGAPHAEVERFTVAAFGRATYEALIHEVRAWVTVEAEDRD